MVNFYGSKIKKFKDTFLHKILRRLFRVNHQRLSS